MLTSTTRVREIQNHCIPSKGTRKTITLYSTASYVKTLSRKKARIVTQRVPFGELFENRQLLLQFELTEIVESVPPGVFFVFPGISCGVRRATPRER